MSERSDGEQANEIVNLSRQPMIAIIERHSAFCQCDLIELDAHRRLVKCQRCGKVVEAFDYLKSHAYREQSVLTRLKYLEDEAKRRNERVEELKTEEQRIRSRIRTAKAGLVDKLLNEPDVLAERNKTHE